MGIFSRGDRRKGRPVIPADQLRLLPGIGRSHFVDGGPSVVSDFYIPGLDARGFPSPGSREWNEFVGQFLDELFAAAESEDPWAFPGALVVAIDLIGADGMQVPRFVEIVDRALPVLVANEVPGMMIPNFLLERWSELRNGPN